MINKQTIRGNVQIYVNGEPKTKDELITMSEGWSETTEQFFRKMLKQGGDFTLKGNKFKIVSPEPTRDSKGEISLPIKDNNEE